MFHITMACFPLTIAARITHPSLQGLREKNQVWKIPNSNTNFNPLAATFEYMSLLGQL